MQESIFAKRSYKKRDLAEPNGLYYDRLKKQEPTKQRGEINANNNPVTYNGNRTED
ncbi:MAG TPA: hypothetical protein VIY69_10990 [Candidatus Acidoferrales bacterium]